MVFSQPADGAVKTIINNTFLIVGIRLILGMVFIVASADKIADPNAFATSVTNYKVVGQDFALVVATVLPWMELISGLFLLLGVFRRGAGLLMTVLMAAFTTLIASAILRGLDISCGCFTQDPSAARIGWWKVAEDLGLFVLSLVPTFSTNSSISIERYMARRSGQTPPV